MLNKSIFSHGFRALSLGLFAAAIVAPAACSSTAEPITAPGSGGSNTGGSSAGGSGTGGSGTGTGGSGTGSGTGGSSTGTGGSGTGTGTGGGVGTGTGGSTGTGGATGTGGTVGGTGGASGMPGTGGFACVGLKPTGQLISSFTIAAPSATGQTFASEGGTNGGTFVYPTGKITATIGGGSLRATGEVSNYSGFGIYFDQCINASDYTGVSFTIASTGMPAAATTIQFSAQTNSTLPLDRVGMKGACIALMADPYSECHEPITQVPANGTVMVPFAMLMGGVPTPTVSGTDIVGLKWQFPYTGMTATAPATPTYTPTVTITNLKFYGGSGPIGGMAMPGPTDAGTGGGG